MHTGPISHLTNLCKFVNNPLQICKIQTNGSLTLQMSLQIFFTNTNGYKQFYKRFTNDFTNFTLSPYTHLSICNDKFVKFYYPFFCDKMLQIDSNDSENDSKRLQ